jgi:hypothetical protein
MIQTAGMIPSMIGMMFRKCKKKAYINKKLINTKFFALTRMRSADKICKDEVHNLEQD